jgi:hypothetical protein
MRHSTPREHSLRDGRDRPEGDTGEGRLSTCLQIPWEPEIARHSNCGTSAQSARLLFGYLAKGHQGNGA